MTEKIIEVMAEFSDVPLESINEESRLVGDLGLTSLDVVGIISRLEDEFDINVDENQIEDFQTVRDVVNYVKEASGNDGVSRS